MRKIDLTGQIFGRWTIVKETIPSRRKWVADWLCKCACGNEGIVSSTVLRRGVSNSCGCYRVERGREHGAKIGLRHGEGGNGKETTEYRIWAQMICRCANSSRTNFKYYGARGVTVCEYWHTYENFLADMGRRPSMQHSLDRVNVNGNYEPTNCRWATRIEQATNRRNNCYITINNITKAKSLWLREYSIPAHIFRRRKLRGWSDQEALLTPVREYVPNPQQY